jgi:hypothetical protein
MHLNQGDADVVHQQTRGEVPVHRLCAVVLVLSSCMSVQAQNWSIEKGFYFDDGVAQIVEPSPVSSQVFATEPRIGEPARGVSAEVIQPGGEPQIADQSERRESKLTDGATESNTEPPVSVGTVGTDQERDVSAQAVQPEIQNSEISPTGSTTKNPSAAELAMVIERILVEAMQAADECQAIPQSAANLIDDAGELTASVAQSRPAQIVTSEPTGSNRAEGQVLNTFYQDLE